MQKYGVPDMSSDHCVSVVMKTVRSLDPSAEISVDLAPKELAVRSAAGTNETAHALRAAGYAADPIAPSR